MTHRGFGVIHEVLGVICEVLGVICEVLGVICEVLGVICEVLVSSVRHMELLARVIVSPVRYSFHH